MIYPQNCQGIIDVTKPPYNLDNTGKTDCTETLCKIVDDILRPNLQGVIDTKNKLLAMNDPNAVLTFENRMINGVLNVIFPDEVIPAKIIYFPKGTYLVSDTISYSFDNLQNILQGVRRYELNWKIHFKGESMNDTIIKLADNSKGFEFGNARPIVNFIRAEESNLAMTNTFEDITIDCGAGNPGAVGLEFFANNTGKVQNVTIRSSDPEYRGYAGLSVSKEIVSGCYVKNLNVIGFDYGIRVTPLRNYAAFENIRVEKQRKTGFYIKDTMTSILNFESDNNCTALSINGAAAQVILINAKCRGNSPLGTGVWRFLGHILMRNVEITGYKFPYLVANEKDLCDTKRTYYDEFSSDGQYSLFDNGDALTLNLPIQDTPEIIWESPEKWVSVNDFGAKNDGVTDATESIQNALNSGASTIYFNPGRYYVSNKIHIPSTVKNINFMYCDFVPSEDIRNMRDGGLFVIDEESQTPLVMEDLFTWEDFYGYMRFIEHACKRDLVLSDIHTQTAATYFNTVPGSKIYIENCASTIGDGGVDGPYRPIPCYEFHGQKVWARNINPERSYREIVNDNSVLWIMGFKTEGFGTAFETTNGGYTEVLGGTISMGHNRELPAIVNDESSVSVSSITNGYRYEAFFPITARETQHGVTRELRHDVMPLRCMKLYRIPAYIGKKQN